MPCLIWGFSSRAACKPWCVPLGAWLCAPNTCRTFVPRLEWLRLGSSDLQSEPQLAGRNLFQGLEHTAWDKNRSRCWATPGWSNPSLLKSMNGDKTELALNEFVVLSPPGPKHLSWDVVAVCVGTGAVSVTTEAEQVSRELWPWLVIDLVASLWGASPELGRVSLKALVSKHLGSRS